MNRAVTILAVLAPLVGCAVTQPAAPPTYSDEASDSAVVWSGFRHDWGYNHRLNRLGDWIGPMSCDEGAGCEVEVAHAAASGLGSDTATWRASGTLVQAPDAGFLAGATAFELREAGAEGERLERVERVTVPARGLLADRAGYGVLLQGVDVMALEDADMFQELSVSLGEVEVTGDSLSFDVHLALRVDCDALECDGTWDIGGKLDKTVHYGVNVMWLVVGADAPDGGLSCATGAGAYAWSADSPDAMLDEAATVIALDEPSDAGVVGLREFSVALDAASHLVSFATEVRADDEAGGLEAALLFEQWNRSTWDRKISFATSGRATTAVTACRLDLPGARTAPVSASGAIDWDADGAPGTDERAVERTSVALPTLIEQGDA